VHVLCAEADAGAIERGFCAVEVDERWTDGSVRDGCADAIDEAAAEIAAL
jgi:hypothetical protein